MSTQYPSIALARGLSVLFMPAIHTLMLYSEPAVAETALGYILRFFAECVSSHLYMFLMGFFLATGKRKNGKAILLRSLALLGAGYLLNLLRTYLPAAAGLLPASFLIHYQAAPDHLLPLLLTGDILQFAGIAYGLTALVKRLSAASWVGIVLYILIAGTAPALWDIEVTPLILHPLVSLFFGRDTAAFFPLFPWFCYPLAGLVAGKWMQEHSGRNIQALALCIGFGFLGTGTLLTMITPPGWELDFYHSGPGGTLLHTGLVLLWLVFFHTISNSRAIVLIAPLLRFCDRHITAIYLFHWIIVGWGMAFTGYQTLDVYRTIVAICVVNLITALFVFLIVKKTLPLHSTPR